MLQLLNRIKSTYSYYQDSMDIDSINKNIEETKKSFKDLLIEGKATPNCRILENRINDLMKIIGEENE